MNQTEVVNAMAKKLDIPFEIAKRDLDAIIECMTEELANGGEVKLINFGTFRFVKRGPRKGFNAYYRRSIDIPPCNAVSFKAGKELKEIINEE